MGGAAIRGISDPKTACQKLLSLLKGDWSEVQVGKTRVLYRAKTQRQLELLRNVQVEKVTIVLQSEFRRMYAIPLAARMRAIKSVLENALQNPTLEGLDAALEKAKNIDFPMYLLVK